MDFWDEPRVLEFRDDEFAEALTFRPTREELKKRLLFQDYGDFEFTW